MLRLTLSTARPGMVLAMPVFHPSLPGHVLLRPGFTLDVPAMKRLGELHVGQVWIRYPALADVLRFIRPEITIEHANICALVGRTMEKLLDPKFAEMDFKVFAEAVRSMLSKLSEANTSTLLITDLIGAESALSMHSGSVCFLSLLMGLKLQEYIVEQRPKVNFKSAKNVENLGVAAMLHDVGMMKLHPAVVERWKQTGDETDSAYRAHVELGYKLIRGKVEPTAAATVLHHHQSFDGSGWPAVRVAQLELGQSGHPGLVSRVGDGGVVAPPGQSGEQIHVFARILAIADMYDTMRNPPACEYRPELRVPSVRVLKAMLAMARRRKIDPIAFKGLLNVVPAYLPGTIVKLNNGAWAIVADFDPMAPCRPVVRPLRKDPNVSLIEDEDLLPAVDLAEHRGLRIEMYDGHDVLADNFDPLDATEFDLRVLVPSRPKRGRAA